MFHWPRSGLSTKGKYRTVSRFFRQIHMFKIPSNCLLGMQNELCWFMSSLTYFNNVWSTKAHWNSYYFQLLNSKTLVILSSLTSMPCKTQSIFQASQVHNICETLFKKINTKLHAKMHVFKNKMLRMLNYNCMQNSFSSEILQVKC